ncbi:LON peptidase substrate-binding domain-containing protein [Hymenobacter cellulosivorans]|uniref:LON peptidase substrate-binding domain-containing protein n=1 Tax=Hymenobacter cellulosivorans TaxID=2932249 RepID=A0ABY4F5H0_9BACT|nr:LON peptidase substrate-binding domain-containing protein [Hymenobacter cellulosivorans]UOQ51560.1 LON peptidase substrate-binding domain-containing protein [Hymenobacter cellulosivorans]
MPRLLALFPLNLVVFPGEKLNLHIFEPRYRQLVHDCVETGVTFGIPPYLNDGVSELGTEMRLVGIDKQYENGEMDIRTKAVGVFRIREFHRQAPGKLYAAGTVEDIADDPDQDAALKTRITEYVQQLYTALGLRKLFVELPPTYRIYDVAHNLGLTTEQEYQLLATTSELERQEIVLEHLENILPVIMETERLKDRARLNGHFKNLTPPNF